MMRSTRLHMPTLSRLKLNSYFPRQRTPQAKPVCLVRSFHTLLPVIPLVIPAMQVTPTGPVASNQCANRVPTGSPHPHSHLASSLPARAPAPVLAAPAAQSPHTSSATPHPTTTPRVRASESRTWSWNPRLSCSTRFLHPSDGTRHRVIFLELV